MLAGPFARLLVSASLAALVAGCSGAGGAQPSAGSVAPAGAAGGARPSAAAAGGAAADAGPTTDPGSSAAPDATAAGGADASQGGGGDICAALTLDRLAQAVGAPVHQGDSSDLYGMGCKYFTADGKGGVVIQRSPVQLGYDDLAGMDGQHAIAGVGDKATVGPDAFYYENGDGPHTGKLAAAIVGDGFASVVIAPPPSDEVTVALLKDLIAATR